MYFKMKIWNREWVLNLVLRLLSFESRKMFSRSETGLSWNMNPAVVHTLLYLFTSRQQKHLDVHPNSNWLQRVLVVVFSMLQWRSLNAVGTFGPQAITRILREIKARMKLRRSTVCSGVKRRNIWIKLYLFLLFFSFFYRKCCFFLVLFILSCSLIGWKSPSFHRFIPNKSNQSKVSSVALRPFFLTDLIIQIRFYIILFC